MKSPTTPSQYIRRDHVSANIMHEAVEYAKRITKSTGPSRAVRLLVEKVYLDSLQNAVNEAEVKRRMGQ